MNFATCRGMLGSELLGSGKGGRSDASCWCAVSERVVARFLKDGRDAKVDELDRFAIGCEQDVVGSAGVSVAFDLYRGERT